MDLKELYHKKVLINAIDGEKFKGCVNDYVFADENESGKESIIIDDIYSGQPIELEESQISKIKVVDEGK